jgi:hypothetical protein
MTPKVNSLAEVVDFYKSKIYNPTRRIRPVNMYNKFKTNASLYEKGILEKQFSSCEGPGELAFSWNWKVLVQEMPKEFTFLEVGVYQGRVLSLVQFLSDAFHKKAHIYGITSGTISDIKNSFDLSEVSLEHTHILEGRSQDEETILFANERSYHLIFINGDHDYETVLSDILLYSKMLKPGGYLVIGNASVNVPYAYGLFLGYEEVVQAVSDILDTHTNFCPLYTIGNQRVWRKNE